MLRRSLPPAAAAEKEAAMYFIGIDLGTSACKLLLVDEAGAIVNEVTHEYPLIFPHPGWSEQKPEDWWSAVVTGVPELLRGFDASEVAGIGSGGQMHGLVALDEADNIIRPAILWNDGRTSKEVDYLNNVVGKDKLSSLTANIAFAGFTAPKLLWMRENEPENFKKIAKIMLGDLSKVLWEKGIVLRYTDAVPAYIAEKSFSTKYGARNMRRFISREIEDVAAEKIISGYHKHISEISVDAAGGCLSIDVK